MNFTLPEMTTVHLDHMNVRNEKHGDDNVTAVDLLFTLTGANNLLDLFHPDLQSCTVHNAEIDAGQEAIEGVPASYPDVRFPKLAPLQWKEEIPTARVEVDYGAGGPSNILLNPSKVNNFKIELMEGGTAAITFRVQSSALPDGALDKLGLLLGGETQVTLTLPEPAGDTIDGSTAAFEKDYPGVKAGSPRESDATDLFVAANAGDAEVGDEETA